MNIIADAPEVEMTQFGIHPDRETFDFACYYARRFSNCYVYRAYRGPMTPVEGFDRYLVAHYADQEKVDALVADVAKRIGLLSGVAFMADRELSDELVAAIVAKTGKPLPEGGILYAIHLSDDPDVNYWAGFETKSEILDWYFVLLTQEGLRHVVTLSPAELPTAA